MRFFIIIMAMAGMLVANSFGFGTAFSQGVDKRNEDKPIDTNNLKECQNEQDKIEGCVEIYEEADDDGMEEVEVPYKNGRINGIRKVYIANMKQLIETPYKDDIREGIEKYYYENGKLQREVPYQNDKSNGIERLYYENGRLRGEIPHRDDKRNGKAKFYYENGMPKVDVEIENERAIAAQCYNGDTPTKDEPLDSIAIYSLIANTERFIDERLCED